MPRAATATKKAVARKAPPQQDELPETDPGRESIDSTVNSDLGTTGDWFVPVDDHIDFTNAVFYGREGSGKTTAIARMANLPGPGKVLIINAEGGVKPSALRKRGVDTSNLVMWPDPKKGQRVTRNGLEKVYQRVKADLMRDPLSWKAVSWDSVSEIHQAVLDHVQVDRVRRTKNSGKEADEDFVDIADYGTMSKMVRDLLRKYRDLPCHFVATALERRTVDKDTGKPQYGPAVTPGLAGDLMGYVDLVMMFKAADEDGPYRALTRGNSRYRAKDRYDVLPRVMAEPMGDRIIAYITGEMDEETDPFQIDLAESAKTAQDKPKAVEADPDEEDDTPTDGD